MVWIAGAEDSWLRNYVEYARSITDAPLAFHVAGGTRRDGRRHGLERLVARRGQSRAVAEPVPAAARAVRHLPQVHQRRSPDEPAREGVSGVAPGPRVQPERFIRNLADQPTSVLKESEFASLLERMKSNYMQGMKQRLTDLFDCQDSYDRTIQGAMNGRGERIRIVRPALTILAASTLDWLVESLTETDMRSGFMPRFLFFAPTFKEAEPAGGYLAEPTGRLRIGSSRRSAQMSGMARRQVSVQAPSGRRIVEWTTDNSAVAEGGQAPDELMGLYSRLGHHLAKIAALLSVSDEGIRSEYEVTEDTAERAIALMEWILAGTGRVFEERVVFSKFELQAQKALRFIGGGIERGVLLKKMKCPASELDRLLITLKERGEIDEYTEQTAGRPRRMIVRTLPDLSGEERGGKGEVSGEESPNGRVVSFAPAAMQGK
jgi:hypothetical protein